MAKQKRIGKYIFLHVILLMYSFCAIFAKLAAGEEFLSFKFCLFYGLSLVILGVYAILWQQVLKRFSLTTAFFNKAVTIIWGMMWGLLFFNEVITWNMIVGSIIVIIGVGLVAKSYE